MPHITYCESFAVQLFGNARKRWTRDGGQYILLSGKRDRNRDKPRKAEDTIPPTSRQSSKL